MKRLVPSGIKLICYIYLVNGILYLLSLTLFSNHIFILGEEANKWISLAVWLAFISIPIILYFRLKRLKKDAWLLAIYFHIFFLINNSLAFWEQNGYLHSIVRITGVYTSVVYSPTQMFVLILNSLVNLFILSYLFERRAYFLFKE